MLHEPSASAEADPASGYKTRLGVRMFLAYSVVYAGFVLINVLFPAWMGVIVALGLNLAMVYGFSLIVLALVLALIYNALCSAREKQLSAVESQPAVMALEPEGMAK